MNSRAEVLPRGAGLRLAGACAALLAAAALLGAAANVLRPAPTRLPWIGDWDRHIETQAFRAGIPVVFLMGARERLADARTVVFDARGRDLYEAGHLPGALLLPVEEAESRIGAYVHRVLPETPILVYCGGLDCDDALELAVKLRGFGFADVTLYPGGFAEWQEYGGAVRTGGAP
jgi:rhodanese-related sulfurtransferase